MTSHTVGQLLSVTTITDHAATDPTTLVSAGPAPIRIDAVYAQSAGLDGSSELQVTFIDQQSDTISAELTTIRVRQQAARPAEGAWREDNGLITLAKGHAFQALTTLVASGTTSPVKLAVYGVVVTTPKTSEHSK